MFDPRATTLDELQTLLATRAVSTVEVVEAVLRRVDETERHVYAYAHLMPDSALRAARRADADRRRGAPVSPVHGVPFSVKDVFVTHDAPTAAGSRALSAPVVSRDADVVHALRRAGAILIGKTVTQEFACGQGRPPTRNAWSAAHDPGGSSMGSAVSVAVGSALFSVGGDAAGSVRKPAALNGVAGLLPSHGTVSRGGMLAASPSLERVGFLTRTVGDGRAVLGALSVAEGAPARAPDVAGRRIGVDPHFFPSDLQSDVADRVGAAIGVLEELGATLVPVTIEHLSSAVAATMTIFLAEAASQHRARLKERSSRYGTDTRRILELGAVIPAPYVEGARRVQRELRRAVAETFASASLDALVTPTLPTTAVVMERISTAHDVPRYNRFTVPWNLTGHPALSVPCGFSEAGLPIGLQLVGRPARDADLLALGEAYEQSTAWRASVPHPETWS